ncbi:MAG: hypothetical protein ABJM36_11905 [Algibacter sp.]|uniref:hypothetical protein n=1 Tax=Algibacter sp. TaxID=1872428 RepID=UPI003299A5FA
MEEQDYILFEDYISEHLSNEERAGFEQKLKTDKTFAEAFQSYKEWSSFLGSKFGNADELNAFKSNLKNISDEHFNKTEAIQDFHGKTKTYNVFKYAIAACVVILFGIFTFNQFSSPTYSDFNNYDAISLTVRGSNSELLKTAENAFNSKNFNSADDAFKQLLELNPYNSELKLYRAISNIELNNFKISDDLLEDLINGNSAFKNKASWYLALSKLKQENKTACTVILKTIPEGADDFEKAQKLLDKLD